MQNEPSLSAYPKSGGHLSDRFCNNINERSDFNYSREFSGIEEAV
jgi:hypothetical protein